MFRSRNFAPELTSARDAVLGRVADARTRLADADRRVQTRETAPQCREACIGQAVGAAATFQGKRHDEAILLEPGECPIEGPGAEPDAGEGMHVKEHRVPVLRTTGEADQEEMAGVGAGWSFGQRSPRATWQILRGA